jgi:hypothetical protein
MQRIHMNWEAICCTVGRDDTGQDAWVVKVLCNHHVVASFAVGWPEGVLMSQDRGALEVFLARKLFALLHGEV